ncbi:manganese efflux pump MntP family protein [Parvularcula sp. LCG005]|uniref:manganese efflux pump MntP n=1 Tax=Parvularcula sp. LCG005 TaxID=3078805 RepID=UPI002942C5B8|nr:manganese efflux pump MntP family protein [Parvularcula sp. LCG005]WOI52473.1 manganese efflux pump MntP family protein [Parvularcula sp. LCG005]
MSLFTWLPLSLGLSTDAFAASLARGGRARRVDLQAALGSGAIFGGMEGVMCLTGWLAGASFAQFITAADHWIALILLTVIGVRMIREGLSGDDDDDAPRAEQGLAMTLVTAMGTSIDSAAVGIALSLAGGPASVALLVGLVSFMASTAGFLVGPKVGEKLGHRAEIGGGVILILIGVSIFVSHMTGG